MVTTTAPQVEAIRQELPVLERLVYLNTGTAGPLPRRTAAAITAANEQQLLDGRASFKVYMEEYFPCSTRCGRALPVCWGPRWAKWPSPITPPRA